MTNLVVSVSFSLMLVYCALNIQQIEYCYCCLIFVTHLMDGEWFVIFPLGVKSSIYGSPLLDLFQSPRMIVGHLQDMLDIAEQFLVLSRLRYRRRSVSHHEALGNSSQRPRVRVLLGTGSLALLGVVGAR